MPQIPQCSFLVADHHSAIGQTVEELFQRKGRLAVAKSPTRTRWLGRTSRLSYRRSSWVRAEKIPQARIVDRRRGYCDLRVAQPGGMGGRDERSFGVLPLLGSSVWSAWTTLAGLALTRPRSRVTTTARLLNGGEFG